MTAAQTPTPARHLSTPTQVAQGWAQTSLDSQNHIDAHISTAVEAQTSAPANQKSALKDAALGRTQTTRPANDPPAPIRGSSAGPDFLDGHPHTDAHTGRAVEGTFSPQANVVATPILLAPSGTSTAAVAIPHSAPTPEAPLPFKTDQDDHCAPDARSTSVVLVQDLPGDHPACDAQNLTVAGDVDQPTANRESMAIHAALSAVSSPREASGTPLPIDGSLLADQTPPPAKGFSDAILLAPGAENAGSPAPAIGQPTPTGPPPGLADPLLALAADVLDDLESVRIANENRLRQLTRDEEDSDGEERGFGLTLDHPDVARLDALVTALADAEKAATKNLEKRLREHALYPWLKRQKGVGDKQAARLLASIGDPYMRPEMVREDGTVEPARPRTVSELWAYSGYHVVNIPAGHPDVGNQTSTASGGKTGHPDQRENCTQSLFVGVAPKRARGQRANWSSTAKMRAYLIAESCMKQLKRTCPADEEVGYATHVDGCECAHFRKVYDAAREKYANATHAVECVRCGPKGKPAPAGSDLSRKHKQARALRIVAKELLKDLWREARRIHLGEEEMA